MALPSKEIYVKINNQYYLIDHNEDLIERLNQYLDVESKLKESDMRSSSLTVSTIAIGIISCFTLSPYWSCLLPASIYLGPLNCSISETNNWDNITKTLAVSCIKKINSLKIQPVDLPKPDFGNSMIIDLTKN